ncbi:MAG: response regulator [Oscillospiraceae bacterium]|jgi:two-component system response regulator YesN|nr:response regulator [Oscillospiraceae bacterium]
MQILIVDDDLPTVECIRSSIDWEELGIDTVHTAYSKSGALRVLAEHKIDIVLCDVEMPLGSGLELLAEVRQMDYDCEFIFLTCHDSFSFASTALEYKAASYVLKPFSPERVVAALTKVIQEQRSARSMYENSRYGAYWLQNRTAIERDFWKDVLSRKFSAGQEDILREAAQRGIVVRKEEPLLLALFSLQYDTRPRTEVRSRVKWAEDAAAFLLAGAHGQLDDSRIVSLWYGERLHIYCIRPAADSRFLDLLQGLLKRCKDHFSVVVNGYATKDILIDQMAQIRSALDKLDYNNVGSFGQLQLLREDTAEQAEKRSIDLSRFQAILASGNKLRILTYLRTQLETMAPERSLTPGTLYAAQQEITQEVYSYLLGRGLKVEIPAAEGETYTVISNASTSMYNMLKWLSFFINYAVDAEMSLRGQNAVVEQAKAYINAHFAEKITQNEIAKAVFLTPDHLSKVFKKETGTSLNQYINNKRLVQAKELLANSDIEINEVALRSGFSSSSYFITYFRKSIGMTPKEYREQYAGA